MTMRKHTPFGLKRKIANYLEAQLNPKDADGFVSYKSPNMTDVDVGTHFGVSSNVVRGIRQEEFGSLKAQGVPKEKKDYKLLAAQLDKLQTLVLQIEERLRQIETLSR
jgi:hypothetical protein